MRSRTTIRSNETGWVVYFDDDVNNFRVFRSDEPRRFMSFLMEEIAAVSLDELVAERTREIEESLARLKAHEDHAE